MFLPPNHPKLDHFRNPWFWGSAILGTTPILHHHRDDTSTWKVQRKMMSMSISLVFTRLSVFSLQSRDPVAELHGSTTAGEMVKCAENRLCSCTVF